MQIVSFENNFQILFSRKNKNNIPICRLLKILPRVVSVNQGSKLLQIVRFYLFSKNCRSRNAIQKLHTVDSRYLDFSISNNHLSKWKSGSCFNMEI